ncbi:MAG TPA: NHL repeat-containing protein [Solirubrobacteraceae bacterium]|nr:NHL repeat-containing protein [Solirubrobacteraceae bacterium]
MIARQQKWSVRALTVVLLALCAPALTSVPASAEISRSFEASFTGAEAPEGSLSYIFGVAVDTSGDASDGDVYAAGWTNNYASVVDKFNAEGKYENVQIVGADTPQPSFSIYYQGRYGGIAVDSSGSPDKGDVYVADVANNVIDRFSSSGVFECQITAKKPVSAEEIAHECNGAAGSEPKNAKGEGEPGIEPAGLAVAANGDLYVADSEHDVIDEFKPSGEYAGQISSPELALFSAAPLAFDSSGDLYVTNENYFTNTFDVAEFNAAGSFVWALDGGGKPSSVAVDPVTGHVDVYDAAEGQVAVYEPGAAAPLGHFGAGNIYGIARSLAAGLGGKLYAAGQNEVSIFGPEIVVPGVTTGTATDVGQTTATLNGEVEPDAAHGGETTACEFEYVTEAQFQEHSFEGAAAAACEPSTSTPYKAPTDVSRTITVVPNTTYHFRLRAADANAVARYGKEETLTTYGPPVFDGESATELTISAMRLEARINPFGYDTTCKEVQYVDETDFQGSGYANAATLPCAPADLGSGFGEQRSSASLSGLQLDTIYHYRFIATSQAGTVTGADQTFATFGLESFSFAALGENGELSTQAGAHPYQWTESIRLNTSTDLSGHQGAADANLREVQTELPPGLIGDPDATPKCSPNHVENLQCSAAEQIGVLAVGTTKNSFEVPLYNVVPSAGVVAEIGAEVSPFGPVFIQVGIRSGGDYGITGNSSEISAAEGISSISLTLWGVPGEHGTGAGLKPFLRNPTSCLGALETRTRVNSWQVPTSFARAVSPMAGMTGCAQVPFTPSLTEVKPTSGVADSSSGLHFDLHVPQPEEAKGLSEADLKDATITFPAGLAVNPSAADGLQACSEAQAGFIGFKELNKASEPGVRTAQFTPTPAECPDASKLGSVEVDTPLLDHPLPGAVYLARQGENPFGSLLAVYITVYDPVTGIVVKLPGEVKANPVTGQLSTVVDQDPQVPFEDFKINLFEGSRAQLTTPATCGQYTTTSLLSPWSGSPAVSPSASFEVSNAPGGGACAATLAQEPDSPSFSAGTFSPIAGTYSPFVLHLAREDGSQRLSALSVTLPDGLLGKIAGVEQCAQGDIEAAEGRSHEGEGVIEREHPSCPSGSEIGVAHVGTGSGAPFYVTGKAYLAGPYEGAPFSIVAITPAVAGPFDLGVVVVRSALFINPSTAQVTVKTDPFPTILDGIPLDIRSIAVEITRSRFTLNPTSCEKMTVTGTAFAENGQAALSSPFQVGGCNNLPFRPSLSMSTSGKNSKADGASLSVTIASKPEEEANISKVDLQLPVQLSSRLTTLQKACVAAQFESNPAGCPSASDIGTAVVRTPLLGSPVLGPAFLVSHGGEAFPDVEMVLQGEGVTVVVDGKTQIKNGITYSRFESAPDVPFSSLEFIAPQGPFSVFAVNVAKSADYSLCGQNLTVPTILTGQNGVVITQNTKVAVTGCAKVVTKAFTRAQKLTKALKECRHKYKARKKRHQREKCERRARKRYGQVKQKRHKQKQQQKHGKK